MREALTPPYARCGKRHKGRCLAGLRGCYGCGESGYKIRDCPILIARGREGKQASPSGSSASAP
ncbi:hypothetical protein MTR67_043603, partial [Solanum verrucosum]